VVARSLFLRRSEGAAVDIPEYHSRVAVLRMRAAIQLWASSRPDIRSKIWSADIRSSRLISRLSASCRRSSASCLIDVSASPSSIGRRLRIAYFFEKREPKTRNANTTTKTAITSRISLVIVISIPSQPFPLSESLLLHGLFGPPVAA
jgi:hypothetical protein